MDSAWIGVIGALAGVVLGGVVSRNGEYRKWLREERHKAAAELLAAGEAMRAIFTDRAVTGLHEDPDLTEPERRKARIAAGERLTLAMMSVRILYPDRVVAVAEQFEESASAIRHIRLESPKTDPESPGFRYFDRQAALAAVVRPVVVRPRFLGRFVARRPRPPRVMPPARP